MRESADCTGGGSRVVASGVKVSPRTGTFRVTVTAPAGVEAAYYRAGTRVRKTSKNAKTFQTFTLVRGARINR